MLRNVWDGMRRPYKRDQGADGVYGDDGGSGLGGVGGDGVESGGFAAAALAGDKGGTREGKVEGDGSARAGVAGQGNCEWRGTCGSLANCG